MEAIDARRGREKAALVVTASVETMHQSLHAVDEYRAAEKARLDR